MAAHDVLVNVETREVYWIPKGIIEIGRSATAAVVIPDISISSRHARIYNVEEGFWVEDLDSTNGTYVGSTKIVEPAGLVLEDNVQFGSLLFNYEQREDFSFEVTTGTENGNTGKQEEIIPPHTVPSDQAVGIYRRKTSRVNLQEIQKSINEGKYSENDPLPSKYGLTNAGKIAPPQVKRPKQEDSKIKVQEKKEVPFLNAMLIPILIAAILVSLAMGVFIGFIIARVG